MFITKKRGKGIKSPTDAPLISLAIDASTVDDGDVIVATITRSGGNLAYPSTVRLVTTNITADSDNYTPINEMITFGAGVLYVTREIIISVGTPHSELSFYVAIANVDPAYGRLDTATNRNEVLINASVVLTPVTITGITTTDIVAGNNLVLTVSLSQAVPAGEIRTYAFTETTDIAPANIGARTFNNGVTNRPKKPSGTTFAVTVPAGVSTFTITYPISANVSTLPYANFTLASGASATGKVYPSENTINALENVEVYEAPYQALSPAQKTAVAGNGGYAAFAVSRDNELATSFNLYRSATANGTYTQVLSAQTFMPSANLTGAIDHVSSVIAYNNEIDMPASITADSNGLLVDTAGNIEMCLIGALTTNTVFGVTAKNMINIKRAAYHYLPVHVDSADSARMFVLPAAQIIDPTLHAQGATVYYKVIPVNEQGVELALSSVTPIAFTATGVANKPYPPKFVGWNNTGAAIGDLIIDDFELYPTYEAFWQNPKIYVGNSDRTEATPSSLMNPATTMEAGTSLVVEELNRDDAIRNSYTVTGNKATINNAWSNPTQKYRVYAVRGGVRSQEVIYTLNNIIRDIGGVASVSSAIVGANAEITINLTAQSQTVTAPWAIGYTLTGSVMTDNAHGAIALTNGATFEDNGFIQVPPALSSFKVVVPLVNAASKTLTFTLGWFQYNDTISTTINVPAGVAYADLVGIVNGSPSVTPTDTLGDPYQLQMSYPSNNWYGAFRLTHPQPNIAGTPRLLTDWAIDEEIDIEFEFKTSIASVTAGSYNIKIEISGVAELEEISITLITGQNGNYAGVSTARFKNTSGTVITSGSPAVSLWLTNPGSDTNFAHTVTIRNLRIL